MEKKRAPFTLPVSSRHDDRRASRHEAVQHNPVVVLVNHEPAMFMVTMGFETRQKIRMVRVRLYSKCFDKRFQMSE